MSEFGRCENCVFWLDDRGDMVAQNRSDGECWRYPPVRIPESNGWHRPETDHRNGCGEFCRAQQAGGG